MATRRFDALCATTVSATTFCGVNISATNLTASSVSLFNQSTLTATNLYATTVTATNITATTFSSTTISATNITASNISAATYQNISTFQPSAYSEVYDDFIGAALWGGSSYLHSHISWACSEGAPEGYVACSATNNGVLYYTLAASMYPASADTYKIYNTNNNPIMEARVLYNVGAVNSIMVGFADIPLITTHPTSGIWLSAGIGKKFVGICKNGAASSMVSSDSAVTATSGTWYTFRVAASETSAQFFVDNVSLGVVTSNIPSATSTLLLPSVGSSNAAILLDYVYLKQDRT